LVKAPRALNEPECLQAFELQVDAKRRAAEIGHVDTQHRRVAHEWPDARLHRSDALACDHIAVQHGLLPRVDIT
jgi:hypothetical protein